VEESESGPIASQSMASANIDSRLVRRESQELIVAFSGAIGAGIGDVLPLFEEQLWALGYEATPRIKISELIKENAARLLDVPDVSREQLDRMSGISRYSKFQDLGNALREKFGASVLAQLSLAEIALHETRRDGGEPIKNPRRVAFLVDSLKHHEEVHFLRQIYGNNFYFVGILSSEQHRLNRLIEEARTDPSSAKQLIDRDRKEHLSHGQQLDKALKLADFFIRNTPGMTATVETQVRRFCKLMHGAVDVTPTQDEFGMYVAHSSSLASACMSRQVGAAILSRDGTVISTGCNDVPKAGGGLYQFSSGSSDSRCVMQLNAYCHNDSEKEQIRKEIFKILINNEIDEGLAEKISNSIKKETRLGDLIEFSRAVHAEMDALISVSRKGGASVLGAALYTTTYPCHNCARHVIASGISKVIYVEPYEKSLAISLHSDAIVHDGEPSELTVSRIPFLHFEGVAPRRYQDLFIFSDGRKGVGGQKLPFDAMGARKKIPQMLDNYREMEKKILQLLRQNKMLEQPAADEN